MEARMNSKKFVLDFVKRHKAKYIFGIIFVLVVDVLQMVLPRIIGQITDDMQNRTINKAMLLSYAGLILLVALLTMTFRYLYRIYIIGTEKNWSMSLEKNSLTICLPCPLSTIIPTRQAT